ncbi:MAG: class I SAM-dependent methyltransferase [Pseudomonadota bacterium]
MKPLYLSTPVRKLLGSCLRPGGEVLTRRIIDLTAPRAADRILDAGCGTGTSMTLLKEHGIATVIGLDLHLGLLQEAMREGRQVAQADLVHLPLPDGCLDMILGECVWNLTDRPRVLSEFARVLRPGGHLALSDIFSRATAPQNPPGEWPVACCFSRATDLKTVQNLVTQAGFEIIMVEDHTRLLNRTAAEFVFAHGSLQAFWQAVTGDVQLASAACTASAATRPGLFLLIARLSQL